MIKGDILDVGALTNTIREHDIEAFFHLAVQLPKEKDDPSTYTETNDRGTLDALNTARDGCIEYFMYASTMSVYSTPPDYIPVDEDHPVRPATAYGVSKLNGELHCKQFAEAMDVIVLRYSGVYGRHQPKHHAIPAFVDQALHNRPITIFGDGTQTSDYVYVNDVVEATISAFEKRVTGTFNIGSGEETSVIDLARRIVDLTGSESELSLEGRPADRPFRFVYDISESRHAIGYSPILLDEGLSLYIEGLK
jgi:UDP-glucose 4-epimerase